MPTSVALLVLLSALIHASWNAMLKGTKRPEAAVTSFALVSALGAWSIAIPLGLRVVSLEAVGLAVGAGTMEAVYVLLLAKALASAPLGQVYTLVRGGALALLWPASVIFLGEAVTPLSVIGTLSIVAGLAATGLSDPAGRRAEAGRGLVFASVASIFVAGYSFAHKLSLSAGAAPHLVNALSLTTVFVISAASQGRGGWRAAHDAFRRQPLRVVVAGLLGSAGFVLFLIAMRGSGAGAALTLRNTSILFAQGLGLLMGERPRPLALLGAALVVAGAVMLTR